MRPLIFAIFVSLLSAPSMAVSLSQVIRDCGDDGKAFCKGVGYGKPMQDCLAAHKPMLRPACQAVVTRLQAGEKVHLFGN
jgi:hypothetical protein